MSEPLPLPPMSFEEYLEFEEAQEGRHELVDGLVYAVSGGTVRHARIAGNLYVLLRTATHGGPCEAFLHNLKARVARDRVYYPDVLVACTPLPDSARWTESLCLAVEVLSPSTARVARSEKRDAYQALPSLQAYVLVEQERRLVTVHARQANGRWRPAVITDTQGAGRVTLPCPGVVLTLDAIYEGTTTPPAPALRVREELLAPSS